MVHNQTNRLVIVPDSGDDVVRSRRSLVTTNRGKEIIVASGDLGEKALEAISNTTSSAASTVRTAGTVRDMMRKGAEATREISQEEAEAERELYREFLKDVKAATSYTNQATLMAQAKATQRLQERTLADEFEDIGAGVADTLLGRPDSVVYVAQRLLNGDK